MLPFDVILFDVGGVLLTNGWDHRERAAAVEAFNLDKNDFESRHAEVNSKWESGAISMEAYLGYTVFYEPRSFSLDEFAVFIFGQSRILPNGALPLLKELSAGSGYLLGALNNEARETNEYRFNSFGLRNYFDLALSSCYLGLRKPDEAIYRRAIDIVGGDPGRILFIDDREENVTPAKAMGMAAIQFESEDKLRGEFGRMGVL